MSFLCMSFITKTAAKLSEVQDGSECITLNGLHPIPPYLGLPASYVMDMIDTIHMLESGFLVIAFAMGFIGGLLL